MSILGHHISDATKSMDKLHASLDAMEEEFAGVLKDVMPRALATVPPVQRRAMTKTAPIILQPTPPRLQWAISESCSSSSITSSSAASSEISGDETTDQHSALHQMERQLSMSCDMDIQQLLPPWPASAASPTEMSVSSHSYYGSEALESVATIAPPKKPNKKKPSKKARSNNKGDDASNKKRPNHSADTISTLKSWLKCHERHPVCVFVQHFV
jgi:hypothetical protein